MKFEDLEVIKNKRRKKISFEISVSGEIVIKAPEKCSKKYLRKIFEENYDSIMQKYHLLKSNRSILSFEKGSFVPFKGHQLKLDIRIGKGKYEIVNNNLILKVSEYNRDLIRKKFVEFLRNETKKSVLELINEYENHFDNKINSIRIKKQEKRWGSCSSRGNLNFNYDLIMMDEKFIRYVVVHELCHLFEMNHSKEFWDLVENYIPDYNRYRSIKKIVFY